MSVLARQGTGTVRPWSLTRDNQVRDQLEAGLGGIAAAGVAAGGEVTRTTGFGLEIASGTTFWAYGMLHTLSVAQAYTANSPSATVYVWGKITRTAANQANPADSDTYALTVTHNTTGVAPTSEYFPLAILTTDGSGITAINSAPPGKYVRVLQAPLRGQQDVVPSGVTGYVNQNDQVWLFDRLEISGALVIGGRVRIDA